MFKYRDKFIKYIYNNGRRIRKRDFQYIKKI